MNPCGNSIKMNYSMRLFLIRPDQRNRIYQALDIRKIVKKAQMFIKKLCNILETQGNSLKYTSLTTTKKHIKYSYLIVTSKCLACFGKMTIDFQNSFPAIEKKNFKKGKQCCILLCQ